MDARTLLVEDHPDTQAWMTSIIARAFDSDAIDVAGGVEEARALLATKDYARAIIDLSLPDGSGVEVIALISRDYPRTQAVVATIFDDEAHLMAALKAGAKGYVLKDQPEPTLVRVLEGLGRGEPPLSPAIARRILDFFESGEADASDEVAGAATDAAQDHGAAGPLTEREAEVLEIIARGASKMDVARSLGISPNTVATHVKSIYRKLDISSRAEASLAARKLGLLED